MGYSDDLRAYQMGYDGLPFSAADPGYGQWLRGQNDRFRDDQDRADAFAEQPPYPVVVQRDEFDVREYVTSLILAPVIVGLAVLLVALLAGWDYTKWGVIAGLATFAIVLLDGVLRVWDYLLGLAILIAIIWWVLHLLGIVSGLPW